MIGTLWRLRVRVYERSRQPRNRVQKAVLGVDGHLMGLDGAGTRIDHDLAFGPKLMADPAQSHLANVQDPWRGSQDLLRPIDELWVNGIHEAPVDLPRCLPQDGQNRQCDQQPDNRIRPIPADCDTPNPEQDSE